MITVIDSCPDVSMDADGRVWGWLRLREIIPVEQMAGIALPVEGHPDEWYVPGASPIWDQLP